MRWLTVRGWGLVGLGLLLGTAAVALGQPDLLAPGLFLALLPVLSWLVSVVARPRFTVDRTVTPPVVAAGESVRVGVRVTARGALPGGTVIATDTPPRAVGAAHRFLVAADRRARVTTAAYTRQPSRRGRFRIDPLTYRFGDVLGLVSRSATAGGSTGLLVTPRVLPLRHAAGVASGRQGETPIPQIALAGPDDALVRDYRSGDDRRRIHWPSTARTGQFMVRREEQAWDPTAWLLLDSRAGVHDPVAEVSPSFEWLVSAAASVGVALLEHGYELALTDAAGETVQASPHHGLGRLTWLEHLAEVDLSGEPDLALAARTIAQATSGHLIVALLADLDAEQARHLVTTHDASQRCVAIMLPGSGDDRIAGERLLLEHGWTLASCPVGGDLATTWAGWGSA